MIAQLDEFRRVDAQFSFRIAIRIELEAIEDPVFRRLQDIVAKKER